LCKLHSRCVGGIDVPEQLQLEQLQKHRESATLRDLECLEKSVVELSQIVGRAEGFLEPTEPLRRACSPRDLAVPPDLDDRDLDVGPPAAAPASPGPGANELLASCSVPWGPLVPAQVACEAALPALFAATLRLRVTWILLPWRPSGVP
jgi:hypothetical protein